MNGILRSRTVERVIEGKRLGRHVTHDARSRKHPAKMAAEIVDVEHKRNVLPFDQGDLGSCTGNACAGALSTEPFTNKFNETYAVKLYSAATRLDRIKGVYPPTDTGSSGLAVMKAAKNLGLIPGYSHAFGLEHVLKSLALSPCIVGMAWLTGCDTPDENGLIKYTGSVRGGHEIQAFKVDKANQLVGFWNSWGKSWGKGGQFFMTWADLDLALRAHGDATFPTVAA
jgi:hypothetical protein